MNTLQFYIKYSIPNPKIFLLLNIQFFICKYSKLKFSNNGNYYRARIFMQSHIFYADFCICRQKPILKINSK